jgi:1-acyl-sn-glycerol-3-phosphate acyltransferase
MSSHREAGRQLTTINELRMRGARLVVLSEPGRLAIEQGYPIVPFAAVGAEEMLDVVVDRQTPVYGQLSRLYEKVMGFPTPPIVRGFGPTAIPRPERLYFWFGEPIDSRLFGRRHDDTAAARALRDEVRGTS